MTTLSTTTTFVLVDTRDSAGTVNLPPAQETIGRMIILKDQWGTFGISSCSIQADGSDTFAQGGQTRLLTTKGHSIQLIAGADQKWYTLQDSYATFMRVANETAKSVSTGVLVANVIQAPQQAGQQSIVFS